MSAAVRTVALALGLLGSLASLRAAPRWKIQYLYDQPGSNFDIRDIACPSAQRCVAAGVITDRKDHEQGAVVVTSDGGRQWSQVRSEGTAGLAILPGRDARAGWSPIADCGRPWRADEAGPRSKIARESCETHFLDANHGYIAGTSSLFDETFDGGKTWTQRAGGQKRNRERPRSLIYDSITFSGTHGIVVGEIDPSAPVPDLVYPAAVPTDLESAEQACSHPGDFGRREEVDFRADPARCRPGSFAHFQARFCTRSGGVPRTSRSRWPRRSSK